VIVLERRVINPGDLKARIENTFKDFYWVNKYEINAKNDPFWAKVFISPDLIPFYEIEGFLNFLDDNIDKATCTIVSTNKVVPIGDGYGSGEEFIYFLGTDEIKALLTKSYDLSFSKYIDAITKVNEDIHIIIKEKQPLKV